MIRLILFLAIMLLAAVLDIKDRRIPDWIHLLLVGVSFIPPEPVHIMGVFAALPLFIAGITTGGVGGGDIKLIGACGLVLGISRTLTGLFLGLCFLLIYHGIVQSVRRIRKINT